MELRDRRCIIYAFSTEHAVVGVKYGDRVVEYFEELLGEELEKAGLIVEEEPTEPQPHHVLVEGSFRKIDAGNRVLRLLLKPFTFLFGAVLWVQGTCSVGDEKVLDFDVLTTHGGGFYSQFVPHALGGRGEAVLERCTKKAAKRVAGELVQALSRWTGDSPQ